MSYPVLTELGVEMLALAWYPHVFFRLSFGTQDRIGRMLDHLNFSRPDPGRIGNHESRSALHQAIVDQWQTIGGPDLLRYVPQRLLTPFFAKELQGLPDSKKDKLIRQLAAERFEDRRPLYRFSDDGQMIRIHPDWHRYLSIHRSIVKGWVLWHWVQYLQARNPNVPAIPEKLTPPVQRGTLTTQRDFWKAIWNAGPCPACILDNLSIRKISLWTTSFPGLSYATTGCGIWYQSFPKSTPPKGIAYPIHAISPIS